MSVVLSRTGASGLSAASAIRTRPISGLPPIRLTELTDCGGCAAKLGADLLADALSRARRRRRRRTS